MDITRRSFLAGLGSVSVGLLFRRRLDAVLDSLEQDLVAEQQSPDQAPSAVDVVVVPEAAFRPERIVVPIAIAHLFVIEDIRIGSFAQFAGSPVPAEIFVPDAVDAHVAFDTAAAGTEIRFRVRYVGDASRGARFYAAMIGTDLGSGGRRVLPIDSGCAIVS